MGGGTTDMCTLHDVLCKIRPPLPEKKFMASTDASVPRQYEMRGGTVSSKDDRRCT